MAEKLNNIILDKFKKMFKFGVNPNANEIYNKIFSLDTKLNREKFDTETQRFFTWWMTNTHDTGESWKNRTAMFEDMEILYYNAPLIARAIELVADETLQLDSNNQPIFIDAKRNVKKFIQDFFDKINIYSYLRPMIVDLIQYGNAGWVLGFDNDGISEIIPVDPKDIVDRLEFVPYEVRKKIDGGDKFFSEFRKLDRVEQFINSVLDKENSTSYYKPYLFGFQVDDKIMPPWKFLHFRNLTTKSPFKPFGIPMFIHSMSAYRQYDAAMSLQVTARSSKFPKNLYKINLPNIINPVEKFEKAIELMNEINNSGLGTSRKEMPGINDTIVTVDDLFTFEQIIADIDLGKIDDIQLLRDDLINSTFLPRNIIDPNDSGFGDSGISLAEKFKPFARFVNRVQTIVMENITQLVKLHMIYSNQFVVDDVNFILSMPYPESQTNNDIISSQSNLLALANDVINSLQDKITGGQSLPPEIIKSVYTKFLPYDDEIIERWVNESIKVASIGDEEISEEDFSSEEDNSEINIDSIKSDVLDVLDSADKNSENKEDKIEEQIIRKQKSKSRKVWKMIEQKYGRQNLKETVEDITLEEQQKVVRNQVIASRHVYSSKNGYLDFKAEDLREFDKKRLTKLQEKDESVHKDKQYLNEEIKYEFERKEEN